jgi:biopolymer transport protein ExbB
MNKHRIIPFAIPGTIAAVALCLAGFVRAEAAWWDKGWTQRQQITLDTSGVSDPIGETTVLVRLSEGRFNFAAARQDGSDIRFVAADGKTILTHHIETYDGLLNEAFVWVRLADLKPGAKESIYIYYGNQDTAMSAAANPTGVYGDDLVAVHQFAQSGRPPADSTANGNNADALATTAESSIIGNGLRLLGNNPVTIPNSESLTWTQGQDLTIQMWIKPSAPQPNSVLLSRTDGDNSLRVILDNGVPFVETAGQGAPVRSEAGSPVAAAAWTHLALTATGGKLVIRVNGEPYTTVDGVIPALAGPLVIGGLETSADGLAGFTGELDEFRISSTALPEAALKFAFINQGLGDAALRAVALGEIEGGGKGGGGSEALEHVMLFGDIAKNMMFDGWIAVGVCILMIIVGWTVAIRKFVYLNKIEKGNKEFLKLWKATSTDLTALDHADTASIRSMGGSIDEEDQELMRDSPLYQIYHIGSEEISHRLEKMSDKNKIEGLPGRSIQAIRASLDAGLIHENHRLTDGLVYLTISVAGGPYVGLLGTVVGVMITFALIAKTGEVNVNAIAPGIASALLATVAGLVVAIPALFIYSYLNGRIKNTVSTMHVFIDEFVAKMAEFYRPQTEESESAGRTD